MHITSIVPAADYAASPRRDGWDGGQKSWFLELLAEHGVAARAAEEVGKGGSGLYALRARDEVFGAAWDAARLLAREQLFDTLVGRAFDGEVHVTVKDGHETQRRRRDYRLGMGMLDRLNAFRPGPLAELFVRHFEEVREMIEHEAGPSEWRGWFYGLDHEFDDEELRDLFPLPEESAKNAAEFEIWEDRDGEWRTDLPPPDGFLGEECGRFGEACYDRELSAEEEAIHRARLATEPDGEAPDLGKLERGRIAWADYFGGGEAAAPPVLADDDDDADGELAPIEVKSMEGAVGYTTSPPLRRGRATSARGGVDIGRDSGRALPRASSAPHAVLVARAAPQGADVQLLASLTADRIAPAPPPALRG